MFMVALTDPDLNPLTKSLTEVQLNLVRSYVNQAANSEGFLQVSNTTKVRVVCTWFAQGEAWSNFREKSLPTRQNSGFPLYEQLARHCHP
jgi:hypothetical protein